MTNPYRDKALAAWGDPLPDWIEALAAACGKTSQNRVGAALNVSGSMISMLLSRTYGASTARIEERVRGVFMKATVDCPARGELPTHECQDWRAKADHFQLGNPDRLRMFRACGRCPRHLKEDDQ